MITLTFQANDIVTLMGQLTDALDMLHGPSQTPHSVDPDPVPAKPAKAKKAAVGAPVATPEPLIEVAEDVAPKLVEADNTKAMLKLKDDTIAKLQQAFADGKVKKLRTLLENHGGGAKSFPEVAIENFPEIAQLIENGALS